MRLGKVRKVHFVGIGGIGMSGIAEVLLNLGYEVSGSDLHASPTTERLRILGARIAAGHRAENVGDADVVVVSSAVPPDNPEVRRAHAEKTPVIPRAEMLAELMRMKFGVAVAGSHGKTSTTSMIATICEKAGLDPTFVIGGRLETFGSSARLGRGQLLVCEADESDGSFLKLSPTYAVVTNIDDEHLVHYGGSFEGLRQAFLDFINKVPFWGASILCLDCTVIQGLLPRVERRYVTYGCAAQADVRCPTPPVAREFGVRFPVEVRGQRLGEVEMQVPGIHSVQNALAAVAAGLELEIPFPVIREGLEAFHGADRRFQRRGEEGGILVVDDYGHHPTEITATLAAARAGFGRRLVVVFQPHRYTRVRDCREGFERAFYDADVVIVTEVYAAGEETIPGATGEALARGIAAHGHKGVHYVAGLDEIPDRLEGLLRPGDLVLTLGAGNVWRVGDALLRRLRREETA